MDCYCISLKDKSELKERLSNLKDYFGDKFNWFDGIRLTECEFKNLVITNYISPNYTAGRKDFKELIGECGAWVAHRNLWKLIVKKKLRKVLIVEDGSIFNPESLNTIEYGQQQITFVNEETRQNGDKLYGFGLNGYIIGYKTAIKLLELTQSIIFPLDLMIINICNKKQLTWYKGLDCIKKDRTIAHSTSDKLIDQNNDFSSKQDFRTLLERFFLNDVNVLKREKPKLAFCATYPTLGTGYAKVGYEFTNKLIDDFEVLYLGFQHSSNDCPNRDINERIRMFDLAKLSPNSPGNFGFPAIPKILDDEKPDYLMIYNDCGVICDILQQNKNYSGKIIAYLDLVYEYQNEEKIKFIRDNVFKTYVFTEFFKQHLINYYSFEPNKVGVINHGFNKLTVYENSREKLNINTEDFIVLNINRNSYRKRLEVTIDAFIRFLEMTEFDPRVKLQLSCHLNTPDGLDIINYLKILSHQRGVSFDKIAQSINNTSNPMNLPDDVTHGYYQAANVVLTSSVGEGWGLSVFEGAYYGKHIISTDLPTHKEFLHDYNKITFIDRIGEYCENNNLKGMLPVYNTQHFTDALYGKYTKWVNNELHDDTEYKESMYERYNWDFVVKNFVFDVLHRHPNH